MWTSLSMFTRYQREAHNVDVPESTVASGFALVRRRRCIQSAPQHIGVARGDPEDGFEHARRAEAYGLETKSSLRP